MTLLHFALSRAVTASFVAALSWTTWVHSALMVLSTISLHLVALPLSVAWVKIDLSRDRSAGSEVFELVQAARNKPVTNKRVRTFFISSN